MNVGIFGGSFNPIHNGHLAIAIAALEKTALDEVWLMVSPLNPFKTTAALLPDDLRLELAQTAVAKGQHTALNHVKVSNFEFSLPRPSYTIDTLEALSRTHPEHAFSMLIGADNWLAFDRWHRGEEILNNYPIIIYPRKGYDIDIEVLPPSVTLLDMPLQNTSSTEVRRRIAVGEKIEHLVPACIIPHLITHKKI